MNESTLSLENLLEALLFTAQEPLSSNALQKALDTQGHETDNKEVNAALEKLQTRYAESAVCLMKVASGYQFQVKEAYAPLVQQTVCDKPARYSKALLETLALIAYRQPITRGEIEEIRGVSTSTSLFKILQEERGWVRVVGHKSVPGKPGLYATTKAFLDYFNLNSLEQLPPLPEQLNLETIEKNLQEQLNEALSTEQTLEHEATAVERADKASNEIEDAITAPAFEPIDR